MNEIVLPYTPRPWFQPMHDSQKRWICTVAHRRAGKTVAETNHLIRAALTNPRSFPPPQYAYVAPSFSQAKDLAWGYLQQYTAPIPGMRFMETELTGIFPHGAKIKLFGGAQAFERIRGLYLDGAVLDEFALLHPDCFDVVVRPALADYGGFGLISGTPQGRDHFYLAYEHARRNPNIWDCFSIPYTETTALPPDEIEDMRLKMTPNHFAREMLCSFDAPVEGSYYGDLMVDLQRRGQICKVPWDRQAGVITSWDIGMHDNTSIWFAQRIGREIHIIDFLQDANKGFDFYVKQLQLRGYNYVGHILPHDIKVREMGTGRSRFEVLEQLGLEITICPDHRVDDGLAAVRSFLPACWFDEEKTETGRISLKAYQSAPAANLGTMHARPLKNWAGHAADSFRYLAMGLERVIGWSNRSMNPAGSRFRNFRLRGLARRVS
jgi:phage terminase large subunit